MNNYSNVDHEYNPLSYVGDLDKFKKRRVRRLDGTWEVYEDRFELKEGEVFE